MDDIQNESVKAATRKYLVIVSLIEGIENRLKGSELFFILLNVILIFLFTTTIRPFLNESNLLITPFDMLAFFACITIGLTVNAYWTASSMRLQLKLKLRYFQARYLERKINRAGEFFYSDESLFFNPDIHRIESPDGKETVHYPTKGFLSMDGFVGAAKPRLLSLLMPLVFFTIFIAALLTTILYKLLPIFDLLSK